MATYNQLAMSGGGALGETLTVVGAPYTFTFTTPAFVSQSVYGGDAYFILNSSRDDNTDLSGVYNTPTGDVRMEQFASSSDGNGAVFNVGFNIRQDVGFGNGSFNFTPNADIAANSYTIQSTGHYTLTIT